MFKRRSKELFKKSVGHSTGQPTLLILASVAGALALSGCSIQFYGQFIPSEDAPSPFTWSMVNPGSGVTSAMDTPDVTVTVTDTTYENALVKIWMNDSLCTAAGEDTSGNITAGSFTDTLTVPQEGLTTFHYTITPVAGVESACSTTQLSYTLRYPRINFSRSFYSVKEDGTLIGSSIQVERDSTEVETRFRLDTHDVTAVGGANYTGLSTIYIMPVGVSSLVIDESDFGVLDDGRANGDQWFNIKINPTQSARKGTLTQAQVNLLETAETRLYTFGQALYSVNENAGTIDITVQKSVNLGLATSVDVEFVNGSATSGVHFTGTTQTLNFAIGEDEKVLSVPIADNSSTNDSRSFYARFVSSDTSGLSRSQGITKIRILDNDDTTVCDDTNNNLAVNDGFGGGTGLVGDPYLICSLPQFFKMRNHTTSFFRLMADIDASPDLDADSDTIGLQPFEPINLPFEGNLEGGEYALANYTYDAGSSSHGLFSIWTATSNGDRTVNAFNVVHARVINGAQPSGILTESVGRAVSWPIQITNTLVSGYLDTTGGGMLGDSLDIGSAAATDVVLRNNLTAGTISTSAASSIGGHFGTLRGSGITPTATVENLYSATNLYATAGQDVGGIFGYVRPSGASGTLEIKTSDYRGYYRATASRNNGGIAGRILVIGFNFSILDSQNTGYVNVERAGGGIVGSISASGGTTTLLRNENWGVVSATSAGLSGGIIGIIGAAAANTTFVVTDNTNHGAIAGLGNMGGVIGSYSGTMNNQLLTLTDNRNTGLVDSMIQTGGGIVGGIATSGAISQQITVNSNTNSGQVLGGGTKRGGIVGSVSLTATGLLTTLEIEQNTNSGTVDGTTSAGGIVGELATSGAGPNLDLLLDGNQNTGDIHATVNMAGGAIGAITLASTTGNTDFVISDNTNSGDILSDTDQAGGMIGYAIANGAGLGTIVNLSVTGNNATQSVSAATHLAGGLIGNINFSPKGASTLTVSNNSTEGSAGGTNYVSCMVGSLQTGTTTTSITGLFEDNIVNCDVTGSDYAGGHFGGLTLEDLSTFNLNDLQNLKTVTGSSDVGGLIGNFTTGTGAGATGKLTIYRSNNDNGAVVTGVRNVGGLIGQGTLNRGFDLDILDSYSSSQIEATNQVVGGLVGKLVLSGAAGVGSSELQILDSYSTGTITSSGSTAGGLVGSLEASNSGQVIRIYRSSSSGVITVASQAGGLVGLFNGTAVGGALGAALDIRDAFSNGSQITSTTEGCLGGLVGGFTAAGTESLIEIRRAYTSNTINPAVAAVLPSGGVVGCLAGSATSGDVVISSSVFFLLDAGPLTDIGGVAGQTQNRTTVQLQNAATFSGAGWSISGAAGTTWWNPGVNGLYPTLQ
jgi:hypothetical protein